MNSQVFLENIPDETAKKVGLAMANIGKKPKVNLDSYFLIAPPPKLIACGDRRLPIWFDQLYN